MSTKFNQEEEKEVLHLLQFVQFSVPIVFEQTRSSKEWNKIEGTIVIEENERKEKNGR